MKCLHKCNQSMKKTSVNHVNNVLQEKITNSINNIEMIKNCFLFIKYE